MISEKLKCPRCGSDSLQRKPLTFFDRFVSLISNDLIRHFSCARCGWNGRAHLSKPHHRHEEAAANA